jgi:hypothetical protein
MAQKVVTNDKEVTRTTQFFFFCYFRYFGKVCNKSQGYVCWKCKKVQNQPTLLYSTVLVNYCKIRSTASSQYCCCHCKIVEKYIWAITVTKWSSYFGPEISLWPPSLQLRQKDVKTNWVYREQYPSPIYRNARHNVALSLHLFCFTSMSDEGDASLLDVKSMPGS